MYVEVTLRIGLALSGGGFRATLYHLGVVRFLRDAGLLPQVSHVTSVSGGSVLAAHLVLNWDRYRGKPPAVFNVVRSRNDRPEAMELVKPTHQTRMYGGSVINWSVVHPEAGFTYSSRWSWE